MEMGFPVYARYTTPRESRLWMSERWERAGEIGPVSSAPGDHLLADREAS